MGTWSKVISFLLFSIIAALLLKNLFTKPQSDSQFTAGVAGSYQQQVDSVTFPPKVDPYVSRSPHDDALRYTKLWKLPDSLDTSSKDCLENYHNFHPAIVVQRDQLGEYYGIKTGTSAWQELVRAYEHQAVEICYAYSGRQIEDLYASIVRKSFTGDELKQLIDFYSTELGHKVIRVSDQARQLIQQEVSTKQNAAVRKETSYFNDETERLYLKYLEEDAGWLERNWYKAFTDG